MLLSHPRLAECPGSTIHPICANDTSCAPYSRWSFCKPPVMQSNDNARTMWEFERSRAQANINLCNCVHRAPRNRANRTNHGGPPMKFTLAVESLS
eukprot:262694-Chlamydomonas_euryale.AAC.1